MGDVFRGGNQNVIAKIDSEKSKYTRIRELFKKIKFNEEQFKNLKIQI